MSLSKKHYKKIAELIGKHTVKIENKNFKPDTFYQAINKESIQADFDAINKSMIKINLNNVTESEGN